jgi:hypothetical protein
LAARIEIVPATLEHARYVAANLREADREEVMASTGWSPERALAESLSSSSNAWTGLADDAPVCIFGVAGETLLSRTGFPWMLGTDGVATYQRQFLRRNRPLVQIMLSMFPYLVNYVDQRNTVAIRWLKWLGFKMGEPEPYGVQGLPFLRFELGSL